MKQRNLLLMLTLMVSFLTAKPVMAQVNWQVKAGVGMSKLQGLSVMDTRLSYKIGVTADWSLSKHWAVQPTLYFTEKGTSFEGAYALEQTISVDLDNSLKYFELPVLAAYKLDIAKDLGVTLKAGPYVAYGIVGKAHVEASDFDFHRTFVGELFTDKSEYDGITYVSTKSGQAYQVASSSYKHLDAGAVFGVDITYKHFLLGFEYTWGLLPVTDEFLHVGKSASPAKSELKNMAGHITVGYCF